MCYELSINNTLKDHTRETSYALELFYNNNIIFISLKGLLQIAMGLIGVTTPTK